MYVIYVFELFLLKKIPREFMENVLSIYVFEITPPIRLEKGNIFT